MARSKKAAGERKVKKVVVPKLKVNPSARMMKQGFVTPKAKKGEKVRKVRVTEKAVTDAMVQARRFVDEVSAKVYSNMGKTKTAMVQGDRNPLYNVLKEMCVSLPIDKICSSSRIATVTRKRLESGAMGAARSTGVGLSTARAIFSGKAKPISGELKIQVANLIDAYFQALGHLASKLAVHSKRLTVQAEDVSMAASLIHGHHN